MKLKESQNLLFTSFLIDSRYELMSISENSWALSTATITESGKVGLTTFSILYLELHEIKIRASVPMINWNKMVFTRVNLVI
jgi:hypothetical protein